MQADTLNALDLIQTLTVKAGSSGWGIVGVEVYTSESCQV